ncbi:AEC family transporter [Nanchangia anserum]|uniref:AEC family transporter n=1 Tax=Nanchangia anserum TaxID=2692125 RepID=A0A8I0G819_9ACTO|nr:AEC family transporter [Nanchangia anserum]MBD3688859.1 AEC family transporter [Nanchangia anserum]
MDQAAQGVSVIALLMVCGFVLQRTRALPANSVAALTAVVYWATTPALLFHQLATANVREALSGPLLVAAASGTATALLCALAMGIARCGREDIVLGTMAGSVTNAVHIGLPIAIYVLGRGEAVAPIVIFQLAFLTPLFFTLAEWVGQARPFSLTSFVHTLVTNPMVIAMVAGVAVGLSGIALPGLIEKSTNMLGQAAPPLVLIAFGASLVGNRLHIEARDARAITISVLAKLVLHPLLAYAIAVLIGLSHAQVFQVCVMAALPSAQNAFIAAQRSRSGLDVARAVVALTSVASLGVVLVIAWLMHAPAS